jgi:hypothetical protein
MGVGRNAMRMAYIYLAWGIGQAEALPERRVRF